MELIRSGEAIRGIRTQERSNILVTAGSVNSFSVYTDGCAEISVSVRFRGSFVRYRLSILPVTESGDSLYYLHNTSHIVLLAGRSHGDFLVRWPVTVPRLGFQMANLETATDFNYDLWVERHWR